MIALDTHAWIWLLDAPERLGRSANQAIAKVRAAGRPLHISSISVWEIHMLAAKGRLRLRIPVETWVSRSEGLGFLSFVPVNNDIARLSVERCGAMHGDPADRLIVATALYLGARLVTLDERIRAAGLVACLGS